ncbi:MAG: hypothetical protein JSR78_17085 [Proteobacteria bacterium]|nr:hypothetical protein [Pseudomonadota bacterium]
MRIPDIFRREFQSAKLGWASASSKVQVLRRARSSSMRTNAPPASVGSKTRHQVTEKYQDYFLDVLAVDGELAKQLGIAKRKAYYYVEIDRAFRAQG